MNRRRNINSHYPQTDLLHHTGLKLDTLFWGLLSEDAAFRSVLIIPLDPWAHSLPSHFVGNMTQSIYCFRPEIVKTLHVSITVHTIHFILWAFPPPTPSPQYRGVLFPIEPMWFAVQSSRLYFSLRLWSGHTSWGSENWLHGWGGGGNTSNHRLVLLLILLNGSKRWETLSHIKRQRPHFTHSAMRSQLPTARLQQGLMGLQLCATLFD